MDTRHLNNISKILKYCDDKDTKLKFLNYIIDEEKIADFNDYKERAEIYEKMHKYRHAIRDYRETIKKYNDSDTKAYAYNQMGWLYYKLKDYQKVKECAISIINIVNNGDYCFAFPNYDDLSDMDMRDNYCALSATADAAELMYKIGDFDNALTLMKESKKDYFIDSENILLSKILIAQKKYEEANNLIEESIKCKMTKLILKAQIEEIRNNKDKALQYYKQAEITEETGWIYSIRDVYKKIGELYENEQNYEKAFEYYNKLRKYSGDCLPIGNLCCKLMQYKEALIYYFEGLSKESFYRDDQAELNYKIGLIKKILHEPEAIDYFRRAYYSNKNNEIYKKEYKEAEKNEIDKRNFDFWTNNREREVKCIVRDILDDWLEKEEIDEIANEYINQLLACHYGHSKIGNKKAVDIIKEFIYYIDDIYVGDRAEKLKKELKEIKDDSWDFVSFEENEVEDDSEKFTDEYEEEISVDEYVVDEDLDINCDQNVDAEEQEWEQGFDDGFEEGYQKGLEIMNNSCNAHVDDYNPYEDDHYYEEEQQRKQVENHSFSYQEGYTEGYEKGFQQGKNDAEGQSDYFEDVSS